MTMRSCNSRIPEEHFVCYQTSQRNWVIIKVLYRCLWRYLLSWRISRLGFVTPIVGEVSLGPLGNVHHHNVHNVIKELLTGWCVMGMSKETCRNDIEQGIGILTIESRASIVPIDKGNSVRGWLNPRHRGSSDEIIVEHVGANMGIQIPLLVIDRRVVSVMSACLPNP